MWWWWHMRRGCGTRWPRRRYPELPNELVMCREMQRALRHLISEKRSSRLGAYRRVGTALLKALSESDEPLELPGVFFRDANTIGACVRRVLDLPPSNADADGERSAHGAAARRMHHGAAQQGPCLPSQGGLCTTP